MHVIVRVVRWTFDSDSDGGDGRVTSNVQLATSKWWKEEHAVAFLLPPFTGRELRHATFDVARHG